MVPLVRPFQASFLPWRSVCLSQHDPETHTYRDQMWMLSRYLCKMMPHSFNFLKTHTHTLKTSNGSGLFMASAVAWSKASDHSELLLKSQRSERERKKHKLIHLSIHLFNHPTIHQSILHPPIHLIHTYIHAYIHHPCIQTSLYSTIY